MPTTSRAVLHAGVGAPYAHVTAPLRRLGDRYATECALAAAAGEPVPEWAAQALPELPALLAAAGRRGGTAARAVLDLTEALLLEHRVGEQFDVAVVARSARGGTRRARVAAGAPARLRARCNVTPPNPVAGCPQSVRGWRP